ncbi:MAG: transposase zinc-binding domain-containing protein [Myxococcota bacterium]
MNPQYASNTAQIHPPDTNIEESADTDSGHPTLEIADILRRFGPQYQALHALSSEQARVLSDITLCRTEAMGGHTTTCGDCGLADTSYNSCRNRSCPKCQGQLSRIWVEAQMLRVLETPYFHAVFTVPAELRPLFLANRRLLYDLLMKTAAETLLELCMDPKRRDLRPALTLVLHTWSQDLSFHPHVHCIISSGGLSVDGTRWINARGKGDFLLPMKVVTKLFRGNFMKGVMELDKRRELKLADECARKAGCGTLLELKDKLYKTQRHFPCLLLCLLDTANAPLEGRSRC